MTNDDISSDIESKWLEVVVRLVIERLNRRFHMRTDVSKIKFKGDEVILPLDTYIELKTFARGHGETDLPDPPVAKVVEVLPAPLAHAPKTPSDPKHPLGEK